MWWLKWFKWTLIMLLLAWIVIMFASAVLNYMTRTSIDSRLAAAEERTGPDVVVQKTRQPVVQQQQQQFDAGYVSD